MDTLLRIIKYVRAVVVRGFWPRERYLERKSLRPISTKYGFDRGLPVDRHAIEAFLQSEATHVRGRVLEVVDSTYTHRFGGARVTQADALDIFLTLKANIHGDLRDLRGVVADATYDCVVITQTFNVIDDYERAIAECYRILRPGGVLLATLPTMSPTWNLKINMWRFTLPGAQAVFDPYFPSGRVKVSGWGNRESALSFWLGMAVQDLPAILLDRHDQSFPLIVGVTATK